jgi:hypothetical protein
VERTGILFCLLDAGHGGAHQYSEPPLVVKWWPCLASNLAIAGALCEAFWLGQCFEEPYPDVDGTWHPGCHREAKR